MVLLKAGKLLWIVASELMTRTRQLTSPVAGCQCSFWIVNVVPTLYRY